MCKKPNLIYVFADQLRWHSCGYNGDDLAITPNIDALAKDSLDLCNTVSNHPVCAPYRASLFTGKYTTSTGMVINEIRMNPDHRSMAHCLNDAGYNTEYIGKWHMYANVKGDHENPRNSFVPKGEDRLGFDGLFAHYGFHHEYQNEHAYYHLDTPEKIYLEGYEPDAQTDMAIERMKLLKEQDKPFALFLSIGTPHDPWSPYNVPEKYYEKFKDVAFKLPLNYKPDNDPHADGWARFFADERDHITDWMKVYYAMVNNLDDNIGRLRAAMNEMGLEEDTIFVFTTDHGEMFGAQGRRAKNIFYEEAARVPFLMRWPGHIKPGKNDVCFSTVDVMPTLLSLMNVPCPTEVEGTDVAACLLGDENAPRTDGSLLMCTGTTADFGDGVEWRAFRTEQYTYAVFKSDGQERLFDNINDPYQMNDLIDDPVMTAVKEELKAAMWAHMNKINDTFESNSYYEKNWIQDRVIMRTATLHTDWKPEKA